MAAIRCLQYLRCWVIFAFAISLWQKWQMPFEVSFAGVFVAISSSKLSVLSHVLTYSTSSFTIQLLLIHPLKHASCGSVHAAWQYNLSTSHARLDSGTMSASLRGRGKLPDNACALAWQSIVQHAADTALWPHVVAPLH